jgi:5-methyltetrahydropteroyltriglutamate--homocysteine methyltransferase
MPDDEFRAAQDTAIRDVVRLQSECGLDVANDGEFRRFSYWEKFVRLTQGLVVKEAAFTFHDEHGHESAFTAPYVAGKVSREAPITVDEFTFVKGLTRATPKVTMPAPSTTHFYRFNDYAVHAGSPTSARCTRPRSPSLPPRAAATCSSTRSPSPSCAIRRRARK